LARDVEGKETVPGTSNDALAVARIRDGFMRASRVATNDFHVVATKNLLDLFRDELALARQQVPRCHMQALRHVITPHGVFACPAYRGDPRSRVGGRGAHATVARSLTTVANAQRQVDDFDATSECRNIACIYNSTNRWLAAVAAGEASALPSPTARRELPVFL
jgi:hypothetical protein